MFVITKKLVFKTRIAIYINAILLSLFLIVTSQAVRSSELSLFADPKNIEQVKRGKSIYNRFCSFCHGVDLKGEPDWRTRKPNGRLPAPPHDETGHTWHHADALLFGIVKFGLVPPYAPKNYKSDMPAWGSTLKDDDIWSVLAYIKSKWSFEIQKTQADINNKSLK